MDFNIGNLVSAAVGAVVKVATAVADWLSPIAEGGGFLGGIAGNIVGVAEAVLGLTADFANANEDGKIDNDEAEELLAHISKLFVGAFIATFGSDSSGVESDDDEFTNKLINDLTAARIGDSEAASRLVGKETRGHDLDRQYEGYKSLDLVEENTGCSNIMRLLYKEVEDGIEWKIVRMH